MRDLIDSVTDVILTCCKASYGVLMPAGLMAFALSTLAQPFLGTTPFELVFALILPLSLIHISEPTRPY